jgi:hypothetical protein
VVRSAGRHEQWHFSSKKQNFKYLK